MKVLHILKTEPDDRTKALILALGMPQEQASTVIRLDDSTDYEELIDNYPILSKHHYPANLHTHYNSF